MAGDAKVRGEVVTRFAPSPTGHLHVGNARTALFNWLFARRAGGRFVLRFDDTDTERSEEAFVATIKTDLRWLGLNWDERLRQSERLSQYRDAFAILHGGGRLYPCYETAEELSLMRRRLRTAGKPPVYDRAALTLSAAARDKLAVEGHEPHWRFRLGDEAIAWTDGVRGPVYFPPGSFSDPVLWRADGQPLYTLTSVIDDADLGISHVIRGEDHVANTAVQIELFAAIGAPRPEFSHHALLTGSQGEALSKRLGSDGLGSLRDQGIEPLALTSLLATLGSSDAVVVAPSLADLAADFALDRLGRAPVKFDTAELERLNARLIHRMPFVEASPRLATLGMAEADGAFWLAVRGNITTIAEAATWWQVCHGAITPAIEEPTWASAAAALLPDDEWDESTWGTWTEAVKASTGRKGKALFRPLRLALTGRDHGPEMKSLLPLLGRERAHARLSGQTA